MNAEDTSTQMRHTKIPLPQAVVFYCAQFNIKHVVISPGSRNAPLTNGFVENPFFNTYSIVDERAAAFFALGIAQQQKHPVALVCTSGSALLNYYPAVAEAYYSEIPLVILSADRMPHRVDIGDGQTIQQEGVFGPHLLDAAVLKPDVAHATNSLLASNKQTYFDSNPSKEDVLALQEKHQKHNIAELQRILLLACTCKGPVHLNIPIEEPLYEMTSKPLLLPKATRVKKEMFDVDTTALITAWKQASRKMILIGVSSPNSELNKAIYQLLEDPSVVVLTEKTSNFTHPKAIDAIDCLMAPLELEQNNKEADLKPDLLITIGGMIVSKKIKFYLRKHPAAKHFHIDTTRANDTFYYLSQHIEAPTNLGLEAVIKLAKTTSTYQEKVLKQYHTYLDKGKAYLNTIPFSDLAVFKRVTSALPPNTHLQVANSSPIRYIQLFDLPKGTEIYSNRGTAGIDGSTATAMGAAQINPKQTVLITGDLSFFYDINGLWHNYIPSNARIIIINNQGGGIFRILPGEKDSNKYDTYFETTHKRDAKALAKSFGLQYKRVKTAWGLQRTLMSFFKRSNTAKILEICTPRKNNDTVLLNYFRAMANKPNKES